MTGILSLVIGAFTACEKSNYDYNNQEITRPALTFYGLTSATTQIPSTLIRYNSASVNTISAAPVAITGLQTGESIVAIDYRPASTTATLYGLGSTSRIYTINTSTGAATLVGTGPISPALSGTVTGFDFNPVADRIRIVTTTGQNLRVNPTDASVIVDGTISGVANAAVTGAAYTNNVRPAPTSTELYDLDVASQNLYKQDANTGVLTLVGSLGNTPLPFTNSSYLAAYNTTITSARNNAAGGFDISPSGVALAVYAPNASPAIPVNGIATGNPATAVSAVSNPSTLFMINLLTGKATDLGVLPIPAATNYAAAANIIGLAIVP